MPQAYPFFFGPEQRPLFGWLHRPDAENTSGIGLLICSPSGYDAISSHRTLRHLAEASAAHGFPAVRFDYDGTGDSAGQDTDPARMDAWLDSIRMAAAALREGSGVRYVCIFGIRLGATFALLTATHLTDVAGVILVNPVVEGRRYLRELRALAATSAVAASSNGAVDEDIQEAAGFVTTAETRQAIIAIRLTGDGLQRAPKRVLLLERTDLPTDSSLAERLHQLGCDVKRLPFPGYADMLRDAHETVVPTKLIQDVLQWLEQMPDVAIAASPAVRLASHCELNWAAEDLSGRLREEAVSLGDDGVFGVLTEAASSSGEIVHGGPVLLLLNSGAVHHVGPNRLYVRTARMLALHGLNVFRFDLPGLGDSPVAGDRQENLPYPDWAIATIRQAVDYARTRFPGSEIHCAGICSGAYHSLKAAVTDLPLRGIVVINPLTFFWKPGMSLAQPTYQDTVEMMRYRRTAFSAASVRKLLTGRVNLPNLAGTMGRYAIRRLRNAARNAGRRLGVTLQDDLVTDLRTIQARNVQMHFIFATTDPGHSMLQEQGGAEIRRMVEANAVSIDFIDHSDHTFTPRAAQRNLLRLLVKLLASAPRRPS